MNGTLEVGVSDTLCKTGEVMEQMNQKVEPLSNPQADSIYAEVKDCSL